MWTHLVTSTCIGRICPAPVTLTSKGLGVGRFQTVDENPFKYMDQAVEADYNPNRIVLNAKGGEELAYRSVRAWFPQPARRSQCGAQGSSTWLERLDLCERIFTGSLLQGGWARRDGCRSAPQMELCYPGIERTPFLEEECELVARNLTLTLLSYYGRGPPDLASIPSMTMASSFAEAQRHSFTARVCMHAAIEGLRFRV